MHKPCREHLEEYLEAAAPAGGASVAAPHFPECETCRAEAELMASQARLLRELKCEQELAAGTGFYARVLSRVEAQQRESVLLAFANPAFGRRLIYACLAVIALLSSYLLYTERTAPAMVPGPVRLLVANTPGDSYVGADRQRDREAVLLSLATYRE